MWNSGFIQQSFVPNPTILLFSPLPPPLSLLVTITMATPCACCVTKLFLERYNTHLQTPDREPTTDKSTDTTQVHFGKRYFIRYFIRITFGNIDWEGITYRSRNDSDITKTHSGMGDSTPPSPQAAQQAGECPSRWLSRSKPLLPGIRAAVFFFQAAGLV